MIILFDLDGTLIDSTDAILEGFGVAFKTFKDAKPNDTEIKKLIGYPLEIMFGKLGVSEEKVNDYVLAYKEHYRQISRQQTTMLPLAIEAVKYASTFATLGVVTTKTARYSEEILEHLGVMPYFGVLIGRESVVHPKPHPEPILKALQALKGDPSKTWMIGDTPMDLLSAKAAGVCSVGVLCGYGTKEDLEKHTDKITLNALEAVRLIENTKYV